MKKKIVLAIAIGLCTATIGNSFAKSQHSVPITAPQDTSVVRRLPPMSPAPSDSTDTATKAPPASPQNPDSSRQPADSAKVD